MGLWKVKVAASGHKYTEIDLRQLKARLKTIAKLDSVEVMRLSLQSMLEELND